MRCSVFNFLETKFVSANKRQKPSIKKILKKDVIIFPEIFEILNELSLIFEHTALKF